MGMDFGQSLMLMVIGGIIGYQAAELVHMVRKLYRLKKHNRYALTKEGPQ